MSPFFLDPPFSSDAVEVILALLSAIITLDDNRPTNSSNICKLINEVITCRARLLNTSCFATFQVSLQINHEFNFKKAVLLSLCY